MSTWLEIQRLSGIDRREVEPQGAHGFAAGACPGCGAEPFLVVGSALPRLDLNVMRSGAIAKCCGDHVGFLFHETDTIFGEEEDAAVIVHGRARVYGGTIRP